MVTKEQFVNGILMYIDDEVIPSLSTLGKWGIGTMTILASSKINSIFDMLSKNELVKVLGIINSDGMIAASQLCDALKQSANKYGNLAVTIPIIGTLTFSSADIEKVKTYIYRSGK